MTFGGEFVAQFDVVVDASVEHTGDPRRRIDNRLPTGGRQIDDLQTAVRQRHRAGCPGPRVVGPRSAIVAAIRSTVTTSARLPSNRISPARPHMCPLSQAGPRSRIRIN